jgi:hypothetical protein
VCKVRRVLHFKEMDHPMSNIQSGLRVAAATTGSSEQLTGDVLDVFDAGDLGQAATVLWRTAAGNVVQYNVGARWLTVTGPAPGDVGQLAPAECVVCHDRLREPGVLADRFGTCGYSQCVEAAWPQLADPPQPNRVDRPRVDPR